MAPIVDQPTAPSGARTVTRPTVRARRRGPVPLEQIPAWGDLVPVMDPALVECAPAGRDGRPARRPRSGPAPRGDARGGATARRRGGGHRQDPGDHPPDRVADRDEARQAVRDPRPDLHGQGRRRDGGAGRPARPVRLHGQHDRDVPRLRRPVDPRARAGARPPAGRPCAVARRGGHLPARAPLRVRPRRLSAARRSDALPVRARHAVQSLQGRGHHAGDVRGPRRANHRRGDRPRRSGRRRGR